jgi:hypothetical protein
MPFGLGFGFAPDVQMIFGVFLLLIIGFVLKLRKSGGGGSGGFGPLLVLRKFEVNPDPVAEVHLEIVGRVSGFTGLVFTILRISPESSLYVRKTDLTQDRASLFGRHHLFLPLNKVQATKSGYDRSKFAFFFALFFALVFVVLLLESMSEPGGRSDISSMMIFSLVCAAIAGAIFFFKRTLKLSLGSGHFNAGMQFKRSILEGVTVDLDQLIHASDVLDHYVLLAQGAMHAAAPGLSGSLVCAKCGNANPAGTKFCENCGAGL